MCSSTGRALVRGFGEVGSHLWFLAFLFCFSLLGLPIFHWLKGEKGQALLSRLAAIGARRGGILPFILPLLLVRLGLKPFFPLEQDWADFLFAFYVVQWDAGIPVKLLTVVPGSFIVTLAIYELLVRRVIPLRALFGMKLRPKQPAAEAQQAAAIEVMRR